MPPRRRGGKFHGTSFEPPAKQAPAYPGVAEHGELWWQRTKIVTRAKKLGLWVWYDVDPKKNKRGWPDLFLLGPRGVAWRENKMTGGKGVRDEQSVVLRDLRAVGEDADVWWLPEDWHSGKIENELQFMARRGPEPVDLTSEMAKVMYLATVPPGEIPKAATLWDLGVAVNRPHWRNEARAALLRAAQVALPQTPAEVGPWLLRNQVKPNASPAEVLAAVQRVLTRQDIEEGE